MALPPERQKQLKKKKKKKMPLDYVVVCAGVNVMEL
jgi:hypothetical protein